MAYRKNTEVKNAQANATGNLFNGGVLELRTGAQPASANDAATGDLIASIDLPADAFTDAVAGVISKLGTWSALAIDDGTIAWGRFRNDGDTVRLDVTVAEAGGDLTIDEADALTGNAVFVTSFSITIP